MNETTNPPIDDSAQQGTASEATPPPAKPGMKKRWLYLILGVMLLFVLMPYLIWQATWFGKPLNDKQMADAFADTDHPRNAQHALSQVADRMESPDPMVRVTAKPWYPQAIAAATSSESALRSTA